METFLISKECIGELGFNTKMTSGRPSYLNPDVAEFVPHTGLNVNAPVFVPGHVPVDSELNPDTSVFPPNYMSTCPSATGIDQKGTLFYQNIEHIHKIPLVITRLNPKAKEFVPLSLATRSSLNPLASEFQPRFTQKNPLRYCQDVVLRHEMKLQTTWRLQTVEFMRNIIISELVKLCIPYLLLLITISLIRRYFSLMKFRADIERLVVKLHELTRKVKIAEVVEVVKITEVVEVVKIAEVVEVVELPGDVVEVEGEEEISEEEEEESVYIVDDDDDISTLIFMCR